jgi:hypothetical protein
MGKIGQIPWNKGSGRCKKGHDPARYTILPSGVYVCLDCKRISGAKYRSKNRKSIRMKGRASRYKLSLDFILELFEKQRERCAICGAKLDFDDSRIDHDHNTGLVRGILCISCNTGIGLLKDSASICIAAAEYLEAHDDKRIYHSSTRNS